MVYPMTINSAKIRQWAALVLTSFILAAALRFASVPAAPMLGSMLAAVIFALNGVRLSVPKAFFLTGQAVLGCMVAMTVNPAALATLVRSWPLMLLVVAMVILFGAFTAFCLMRFGSLPGNTAAWGLSPGGAMAMTAMADSFGADIRMVAFMQYLRVFVVVLTASAVSRLLLGGSVDVGGGALSPDVAAPFWPVLETMALAASGVLLGGLIRFPGAPLLIPMVLGATLNSMGLMTIILPPWLLFGVFAFLGWYIGLRFTSETVRYAMRTVPELLLATAVLMALCCGAAWMLTAFAGVDVLTAYLATSPGGLDSVAVIAMGSGCDVPFVLSLQTMRLFAVILAGPLVAKLICRIGGKNPKEAKGAAEKSPGHD